MRAEKLIIKQFVGFRPLVVMAVNVLWSIAGPQTLIHEPYSCALVILRSPS